MCEHMFVLGAGRRSSTPTSTPSTRRSSSATTRRCAGSPVIVGGGVVLAASYEAKAFGVRTAMGGAAGAARCARDAVVVPPRLTAYSEASKAVFEVFDDTTPLVEGAVDRRGLPRRPRAASGSSGTPREIAARLRAAGARARSGCRSPSASPARSSWPRWRAASPSPTACSSSRPSGELAFLHPLPVERLWGVGPVTAAKLHDRGITTVGEVAGLDESRARRDRSAAASGRQLHALAHNRDPRPVRRPAPAALDRGAAGARAAVDVAGRSSTPSSSRSSTASPGGCARPSASAAPSCCGCGSTTSRAPRGRTRCPTRPPRPPPCWSPPGC